MIRIKISINSLSGVKWSNIEEVNDDYMISRQNPEFNNLIDKNMKESHIEDIDEIKVTAYFGNI